MVEKAAIHLGAAQVGFTTMDLTWILGKLFTSLGRIITFTATGLDPDIPRIRRMPFKSLEVEIKFIVIGLEL